MTEIGPRTVPLQKMMMFWLLVLVPVAVEKFILIACCLVTVVLVCGKQSVYLINFCLSFVLLYWLATISEGAVLVRITG